MSKNATRSRATGTFWAWLSTPNAMWWAVPGGTAITVNTPWPLLSWPDCNSASVTVGFVVRR